MTPRFKKAVESAIEYLVKYRDRREADLRVLVADSAARARADIEHVTICIVDLEMLKESVLIPCPEHKAFVSACLKCNESNPL